MPSQERCCQECVAELDGRLLWGHADAGCAHIRCLYLPGVGVMFSVRLGISSI